MAHVALEISLKDCGIFLFFSVPVRFVSRFSTHLPKIYVSKLFANHKKNIPFQNHMQGSYVTRLINVLLTLFLTLKIEEFITNMALDNLLCLESYICGYN